MSWHMHKRIWIAFHCILPRLLLLREKQHGVLFVLPTIASERNSISRRRRTGR